MSRKVNSASVGAGVVFGNHNLSHKHLSTMDFGRIQTFVCKDFVPNDEIDLSLAEFVITTAPNPAPIQGKIKCNVAAFYVPCRVVFPDFNNMITGLSNVDIPRFDAIDLNNAGQASGSQLTDRYAHISAFGLPFNACFKVPDESTEGFRSLKLSILPFRAYRRIWWDWFRNPNVVPDTQSSSYLYISSSNEGVTNYFDPHYACWDKDFLTNNLASPNGDHRTLANHPSIADTLDFRGSSITPGNGSVQPSLNSESSLSNNSSIFSPLSQTTQSGVSSINSVRSANALQLFIERCNVLGGRVIDRLRGMFGSTVQPETLQMSEFLGMNSFDINFETSAAPSTNYLSEDYYEVNAFGTEDIETGNIKGQRTGQSTMTINGLSNIKYHVKEHGYFFVVAWIMPDAMIHQGIDPMWLRNVDGVNPSRFDFLTPEMVNLGFEPLYSYEVCLPSNKDITLGTYTPFNAIAYRGRYASYTYAKDIISGAFIDNRTKDSMRNYWLSRDLEREAGVVNAAGNWVPGKTGTDFVNGITFDTLSYITRSSRSAYDDKFTYASNEVDHFIVQCNVNMMAKRPLASTVVPRIESVVSQPTSFGGSRL